MMTVRKEFKGLMADIDTLRTVVIEQRNNVLCCSKCSNDGCTEKREAPAIPTPAFPITDAYQKQSPAGLMPVASLDVDGVYERRPKPLCPHLEITLQ